ncbi:MAG: insulinase family protein [Planctomycetes bacterium]|nr:insulinase family protein [Planctomycetota bacterium]
MPYASRLLATLLGVALVAAPARADDPPFHETTLENGVRVLVVEAPAAKSQVFLTLLPLGLLSDGAGHTQWSHLLEHFMLRSSEPSNATYDIDGITVNGETTALALRLESLAPPERWREAQRHHAEWLRAGALQPSPELDAMLAREKGLVHQEVMGTSAGGVTHKWALAAWNQVVRHGATHVRALGDVERATTEDVIAALADEVRPGPGVQLVSVGPAPADEVLAAVAEDFGGLVARPPWQASAAKAKDRLAGPVHLEATWDVPVRHYMEWYRLPDRGAHDRMAADALALLVNTRIGQRQTLASLGVQAAAFADLVVPEGRFLLVSGPLPEGVTVEDVRAELDKLYTSFTPNEAAQMVSNMGSQLAEWPDFAEIRRLAEEEPEYASLKGQLDIIEAQQTLFLLYARDNMGLDIEQLPGYVSLTPEEVLGMASESLRPERRSSLLLRPEAD